MMNSSGETDVQSNEVDRDVRFGLMSNPALWSLRQLILCFHFYSSRQLIVSRSSEVLMIFNGINDVQRKMRLLA
jgi:hypothetical protein